MLAIFFYALRLHGMNAKESKPKAFWICVCICACAWSTK